MIVEEKNKKAGHILFVSTHNFATNPRFVKEIELALENNYNVSVLCCMFDNWSKTNNETIKQQLVPKINYYEIPGNRKPLFPWLLSSFWFSFSKILLTFLPKNIFLLSVRSNKRSWLLLQYLKKIKEKTDLVVAHNAGSFYPAQLFAEKNDIPFGIDLEDYHPGETNDRKETQYLKSLLKNVLPKASYITAASSLILEETRKDVGRFSCNTEVVLNYFPSIEFVSPAKNATDKLKLIWFSQNISFNRGLEQVIPVIKKSTNIELHLYGNCNEQFKNEWFLNSSNIFVHSSLPQKDIHQLLSTFDIGLAIEPGRDKNNELAISNKLLAYFQAGLYIVASNTKAQEEFIKEHPESGILVLLNTSNLEILFQELWDHKDSLRSSTKKRFENAKEYSWENESKKILKSWSKVLN